MRRGRALPAVLVLGLVALAGCEDPAGPEVSSATASSEPSSESPTASASEPAQTPTATPTAESTDLPKSQVRAAVLHTAALGQSSATTAEEKAAVTAWMGFWQAAANTYFYAREPRNLTRYAADGALKDVRSYQVSLKGKQERVVGWARDNVTEVAVAGDRATIRDCTENYTFNVDEEGAPQTNKMVPWYDVRGVLEKRQGEWVVVKASSAKLQKSCLS